MDIVKAVEWQKKFKQSYKNMPIAKPKVDEACDFTIAALEELQQYRQVGTIEECRETREKMEPRKPLRGKYKHNYCPRCCWIVHFPESRIDKVVSYCKNCGQAIDWWRVN